MNQYYERIMELKGAEEFKNIVMKWQSLSENISGHPKNLPPLLPDMLWFAKSGAGISSILGLMAEYLAETENLMDFYGDVKCLEFLLSYCDPSAPFTEMQRLIDEVYNAAGFRNEFKGIVYVDIDEWKDHFEEKHFVSFMEYMAASSDNWLIVLSVNADYDESFHKLEAFISMFLRLERLSITYPETEALYEYLEEKLGNYDLRLEDDAKALLISTIEKLRSNEYFDGYKSIKILYQDIAYTVFSKGRTGTLTASMLSEFSADSEYIKRIIFNSEKIKKIGFAG